MDYKILTRWYWECYMYMIPFNLNAVLPMYDWLSAVQVQYGFQVRMKNCIVCWHRNLHFWYIYKKKHLFQNKWLVNLNFKKMLSMHNAMYEYMYVSWISKKIHHFKWKAIWAISIHIHNVPLLYCLSHNVPYCHLI